MRIGDAITRYLREQWVHVLIPAGVFAVTLLAVILARRVFFGFLRRLAVNAKSNTAGIVMSTLRGPIVIWGVILGLHLATQSSQLPPVVLHSVAQSLMVLWIVSLTIMASQLAGNLVKYYGSRVNGELPATSLTRNLAQIFVAMIGLLILLNGLGISITPLLTALGVGGLAVALALQDTLSNLFAGFYISIAGQIRLADYLKLNTGEEGYVVDISWRSTTLRTLANNMVIVPNSKLGQAIVTNFNLPGKAMAVNVIVGVTYACEPDQVEAVLLDEAKRAAGEVTGMVADPAPNVRLSAGLNDAGLQFTVTVYVAEFVQQFRVQGELRKRILKRLRREKIEIAPPVQTVYPQPPGAKAD